MITQARLRELLHYDPNTGVFTRLVAKGTAKVGDVAGGIRKDGYINISVDGSPYLAHRLAWLYVHGVWPPAHTDHIDLDRQNNRIANLREATSSQNIANTRRRQRNTSGVKGVYWSRIRRKWIAQIGYQKRVLNLGGFDNIEEARRARVAAEIRLFGDFRCQAS